MYLCLGPCGPWDALGIPCAVIVNRHTPKNLVARIFPRCVSLLVKHTGPRSGSSLAFLLALECFKEVSSWWIWSPVALKQTHFNGAVVCVKLRHPEILKTA